MFTLFICEKPSQAKDLARNLKASVIKKGWFESDDASVKVTWCIGHLLELCPPERYDEKYKIWNLESLPIIPQEFKYQLNDNTKSQFRVVSTLLQRCRKVVISTDFDREGEAIARNILSYVKFSGRVMRLKLTALDDKSIQNALSNILPGEETLSLYRAAQARAWADWLVGMNFSRLYTCMCREQLSQRQVVSIGRVQTPTLALVVKRDHDIENFVSKPFYELYIDLLASGISYRAKWQPSDKYLNGEEYVMTRVPVQQLAVYVKHMDAKVISYKREIKTSYAPLLFDLTSLQKQANKTWGYSAAKTLDIAQQLYEKYKAITYPRTDCRYLPDSQFTSAENIIRNITDFLPELEQFIPEVDCSRKHKCFNTSKVTAHHAIVPTENNDVDVKAMSKDVLNIYRLICKSYCAVFMPPEEQEVTIIELSVCNELFKSYGKNMIYRGWTTVFFEEDRLVNEEQEETDVQTQLPASKVGDSHLITDSEVKDRKTAPPKHFTENTLLGAMENISRYVSEEKWKRILKDTSGLGTPATRSVIIETLIGRGYVERKGDKLISSDFGRKVIAMLPDTIKNAGMTAVWEQALESLYKESNTMTLDRFMSSIRSWITQAIKEILINRETWDKHD